MIRNLFLHGWIVVPLRFQSTLKPEPDGVGRESECRAVICLRRRRSCPMMNAG